MSREAALKAWDTRGRTGRRSAAARRSWSGKRGALRAAKRALAPFGTFVSSPRYQGTKQFTGRAFLRRGAKAKRAMTLGGRRASNSWLTSMRLSGFTRPMMKGVYREMGVAMPRYLTRGRRR